MITTQHRHMQFDGFHWHGNPGSWILDIEDVRVTLDYGKGSPMTVINTAFMDGIEVARTESVRNKDLHGSFKKSRALERVAYENLFTLLVG